MVQRLPGERAGIARRPPAGDQVSRKREPLDRQQLIMLPCGLMPGKSAKWPNKTAGFVKQRRRRRAFTDDVRNFQPHAHAFMQFAPDWHGLADRNPAGHAADIGVWRKQGAQGFPVSGVERRHMGVDPLSPGRRFLRRCRFLRHIREGPLCRPTWRHSEAWGGERQSAGGGPGPDREQVDASPTCQGKRRPDCGRSRYAGRIGPRRPVRPRSWLKGFRTGTGC